MKYIFAAVFSVMAMSGQAQEAVSAGTGAILRGLDKLNAKVIDVEMAIGQNARMGKLEITLGGCRYPKGNIAGNAYAFLEIAEDGLEEPIFRGWMVGASPALNPLNHPRYDVWVLRCTTS